MDRETENIIREDIKKIMITMDEELDILYCNEEGDHSRKLPYKESFNDHWENKIIETIKFWCKFVAHAISKTEDKK